MTQETPTGKNKVPTYCYQCVAGPDLLNVRVENGVATEVQPNFGAADCTPTGGKVCVKAYGLIQKAYNPHRILTPMKRTNPKKGRDEDPGFVPISWDEALDTVAGKVQGILSESRTDEAGYPRIAASFGGGGTSTYYMGTFPAFLSAIAPIEMGFGSGQGVKCYHSEHLYGELWHRAFIVAPDTPLCDYIISFGMNIEASGGACAVKRHADSRARGTKRVQVEPHLSQTGAASSEWVPIKPKTDPAFMFALIHVLLHEQRERLDIPFLRDRTGSPYLVAPNGYYLRDLESKKPLIYDLKSEQAVAFDTPGTEPALEGQFVVSGIELGADEDQWKHDNITVSTAFQKLIEHVRPYTPLWASRVCDVDNKIIRRIALEYLDHAKVGETIEIDGRTMPYRPVAVTLGKTVNNGWGGYHCCWARTMLAVLVGALEVPGGTIGTTVRINRPASDRNDSVRLSEDGFLAFPMNPTDKENWVATPEVRNANRTLIPLVGNSAWSQALGPTHLAWMQQDKAPDHWPKATKPDLWFVYRTNPAISFWDTDSIVDTISKFPFTVCFAYTKDETNHMADILLPDRTDLEGLQLIRVGGTKFIEQFWDHQGFALRQPIVKGQGETQDFTWISTELAKRAGVLEKYNKAINRGAAAVALKTDDYDFSLDVDKPHSVEDIWDANCKAASFEITDGKEQQGLDYYKEKGYRFSGFERLKWYLTAKMEDEGVRYELPYQETLFRVGEQLGRRLHERGISWWDEQLEEYEALPSMMDFQELWEGALERNFGVDISDFPFWLITSRSMQYSWGGNVSIQMIREVSKNIGTHGGLVMNAGQAREMGLKDGDRVEITSPLSSTRGLLVTREGIRPDTLMLMGQFDHWATPFAKDFDVPSMNALVPMLLDLTDSTGSGADLARVKIKKIGDAV